jgi:hypothetical protein
MNNLINKLLDNLASRTVITLLGIIAASVTIYAFLQEKKVDLRYEIIANTNVLDFNAEISKLEVTYDSTNLKQTKENLRIYTVKIVNNGDQNILKEFYDDNDPIGLKMSSGKIIEKPEIIQTSNEYLTRNVKIINYDYEKINFSQVILETGEFFIIKLLVLHKKDTIPNIISFGKVAGQTKIDVVNAIDVKEELSFWGKVYTGNIWIQIRRLVSYFLVVVGVIVLIIVISEQIDTAREKKRKKKMVIEFKNFKTYQYTRMDDAIFDRYKEDGSRSFIKMQDLLKDEKQLNSIYNRLSKELKSKEFRRFRQVEGNAKFYFERDDWSTINEMTKDGIVFREKDKLTINLAMKDTLDKFVVFLKENNEFKKDRHSPEQTIINDDDFEVVSDEK